MLAKSLVTTALSLCQLVTSFIILNRISVTAAIWIANMDTPYQSQGLSIAKAIALSAVMFIFPMTVYLVGVHGWTDITSSIIDKVFGVVAVTAIINSFMTFYVLKKKALQKNSTNWFALLLLVSTICSELGVYVVKNT